MTVLEQCLAALSFRERSFLASHLQVSDQNLLLFIIHSGGVELARQEPNCPWPTRTIQGLLLQQCTPHPTVQGLGCSITARTECRQGPSQWQEL